MNKAWTVLGWIFGLFFLMGALVEFSEKHILSGICALLLGVIIFPPLWNDLKKRFNFSLPKYAKVILFIILLVVMVEASPSSASNTTSDTTQVRATDTPMPSPTTPDVSGLNITRDDVINGIHKADASIDFKLSTPVNGQERYMAINGQNGIELYGPANNLTEVTSTAILGNTSGDFSGNLDALVYILGVASVTDRASNDWIASAVKTIGTDWKNGQDSVKLSTIVNNKKYELNGEQSSSFNIVSLTIYSADDSKAPTEQ